MKIVNESNVELLDSMGSDLTVVNAARVSFDKQSDWEYDYECTNGHDRCSQMSASEDCPYCERAPKLKQGDERLIKYLATHNHWSPFAHVFLQFRISAPIFVARQLVKHQVGLCWNEVSRRYVDSEPEFYFPKIWRGKAENKKQGSSEEQIDVDYEQPEFGDPMNPTSLIFAAATCYGELLTRGVCPEQARMILPQNTMTSWIWSGSLYAFSRIHGLRVKPDAQAETREVVEKITKLTKSIAPISWKYLTKE